MYMHICINAQKVRYADKEKKNLLFLLIQLIQNVHLNCANKYTHTYILMHFQPSCIWRRICMEICIEKTSFVLCLAVLGRPVCQPVSNFLLFWTWPWKLLHFMRIHTYIRVHKYTCNLYTLTYICTYICMCFDIILGEAYSVPFWYM